MTSTLRGWLVALVTLIGIVGIVAVFGGFEPRPSAPANGTTGQTYELARWDVRFESCEWLPPEADGEPAQLWVYAAMTNTWERSLPSINSEIVRFELPDGSIYGTGGDRYAVSNDREGDFDPDFEENAVFTMGVKPELLEQSEPIHVRLADESLIDTYLSGSDWQFDHEVTKIEMTCEVGG